MRPSLLAITLILAFASGAAALGHEVLWTRRLVDLIGASTASLSRVFGCFFVGLSLGSAFAALRLGAVGRPWRAIAWVELMIALLALPAMTLAHWTKWIWPGLGPENLTGWPGGFAKGVISLLVIGPPAFFMGITLPLLIQTFQRSHSSVGRRDLWVYSVNTLGGVAGLVWVSLAALPWWGATGTMASVIGINLAVAATACIMDVRPPGATAISSSAPLSGLSSLSNAWKGNAVPIGLAFVSGFLVLAFEVLATEMVMLVAPLSFYAPTVILMSVVLMLALGALAASVVSVSPAFMLKTACLAAAVLSALAPVWFMAMAVKQGGLPPASSLWTFTSKLFCLTLGSTGPAILAASFVFPMTMKAWHMEKQEPRAWAVASLLAVNGLGGMLGAETGARVLLPAFGTHVGIGVVAMCYGMLAWMLSVRRDKTWNCHLRSLGIPLATTVVVGTIVLMSLTKLPMVNPNMGLRVIDQKAGKEGTLAVVEHKSFGRAILVANQYLLGSTSVRYDQERQAHLPLMLHPTPKKIAFLGLATGITASGALAHAGVEDITAIELSRLVVDAADEHFSEFNGAITRSSRAHVVVEDARTYIASTQSQYDVIVGDLFLPWASGEGRLFSIEHFQSVRAALKPGGLFCQWLPMYQLTREQFETIAMTFRRIFPKVHLFMRGFRTQTPALALVGWNGGDLDWSVVNERVVYERENGALKDPLMRHVEGLAMLYLGPWQETDRTGAVNTLDNLRIELDAGRRRILKREEVSYLAMDQWLAFINLQVKHQRKGIEPESGWFGKGSRIVALSLALAKPRENANRLGREIFNLLPDSMKQDTQADWTRWPGPSLTLDEAISMPIPI